jgi:hypothetical protein
LMKEQAFCVLIKSTAFLGSTVQPSHGLGTCACTNFWQQFGGVWHPCFRVVAGDTDLGEIQDPGTESSPKLSLCCPYCMIVMHSLLIQQLFTTNWTSKQRKGFK